MESRLGLCQRSERKINSSLGILSHLLEIGMRAKQLAKQCIVFITDYGALVEGINTTHSKGL